MPITEECITHDYSNTHIYLHAILKTERYIIIYFIALQFLYIFICLIYLRIMYISNL